MSVKINSLELENIKRIKAVKIEPTENGLTVIGGKNNQGKTSILDAIAWTLGGDKFKPGNANRDGSLVPPHLNIKLSNGLIVERKGKNSDLKVTDSNGNISGQTLLNSFISSFALDLPKFLNASNKDKADILLNIIGVGDKLYAISKEENTLYQQRLVVGRVAEQKSKFADELKYNTDVPEQLISAHELIQAQQKILLNNAENSKKRAHREDLKRMYISLSDEIDKTKNTLSELLKKQEDIEKDLAIAEKDTSTLKDESTAELERNIAEIDVINAKIRENLNKTFATDEAEKEKENYNALTLKIEDIRKQKYDLLNNASLPLKGLSVEDNDLTYNGHKWDSLSSSEQLKVGAAIVRCLNPDCGFILLDKLEQMDSDTLIDFGEWLEKEGLQAIATRVSTGAECSIIIEDGYSKDILTSIPENKSNEWKGWGKQ